MYRFTVRPYMHGEWYLYQYWIYPAWVNKDTSGWQRPAQVMRLVKQSIR